MIFASDKKLEVREVFIPSRMQVDQNEHQTRS